MIWKFLKPVICHMSHVTCHLSCVTCNFLLLLKLVGGGSVINGATPFSFLLWSPSQHEWIWFSSWIDELTLKPQVTLICAQLAVRLFPLNAFCPQANCTCSLSPPALHKVMHTVLLTVMHTVLLTVMHTALHTIMHTALQYGLRWMESSSQGEHPPH